ncbi:hypothetical protein H6F39_08030 [Anabaena sp. FACHB-1250]|uniref:Uncharacterized protein n=1 Tax=Dolichospermum flos-aquae LEGE 04289 TaxID=1828708 RepID=A0ACC5PXV4_DOLFA|nr:MULTISPECIES: hypothetical protein [Nostocales]MBD2141324.1 hypothetical protein [Anabaena sp. FACHB-1250]MBD2268167.1 hypothetical protein [Anabaena sp. FACHB-1391]MBE9217626.1 hypothetical protein [Dolichospermum flos-aquae LEGE 04289]
MQQRNAYAPPTSPKKRFVLTSKTFPIQCIAVVCRIDRTFHIPKSELLAAAPRYRPPHPKSDTLGKLRYRTPTSPDKIGDRTPS